MKKILTLILAAFITLLLVVPAVTASAKPDAVFGTETTTAEKTAIQKEAEPKTLFAQAVKPTLIPKPSTLPGPDESEQKSSDADGNETVTTRNFLVNNVLPNLAIWILGFVMGGGVIFLIVSGVRFATAYGNEEAVENAKKQMIYAIVGVMVALLAFTIVQIILNIEFIQ